MGSLPNLNDLADKCLDLDLNRNKLSDKISTSKQKVAAFAERRSRSSKVHKLIYQSKSLGENPNAIQLNKINSDKSSSRRSRIRSSSVIPYHGTSFIRTRPGSEIYHDSSSTHGIRNFSRQASVASGSSVRRLIAVVRTTPSQFGPAYSRAIIGQNYLGLCLSNAMFTIAFYPIVILQGSISVWLYKNDVNINMGSLLLMLLYLTAAATSYLSPFISNRIGLTKCLTASYFVSTVFVGIHLYPELYLLVPVYAMMGVSVGHMSNVQFAYMIALASKLKFVLTEEEEQEFQNKLETTIRDSLINKIFRGLTFAYNVGLVLGSLLTYVLILMTAQDQDTVIFEIDKDKNRICGFESCPNHVASFKPAEGDNFILPCKTSALLSGVFLGCVVVGSIVSLLYIHRIRIRTAAADRFKFRNVKKVLKAVFKNSKIRLMTPLLLFIGVEQGFIFADFTKLYVICVIDIHNVPLIFISFGLLQSVAGVTFNLLFTHIRKCFIIGLGFVFQICLFLVLILWKPTNDDIALFYVITAVWGVCNAIWDTLIFSALISFFPDWEFAFSHNFFCKYIGLSIAFCYHGFICTSLKLYIVCALLVIAVFSYSWLEIKLDAKSNAIKSNIISYREKIIR